MTRRFEDGKLRVMRDGAPYYVAPWVETLSAVSKADLFRPAARDKAPCRGGASDKLRRTQAAVRHPQTTYVLAAKEAAE